MNKEIFKKSIIPILIGTIFVTIISNFNFHGYDKYFLFPIIILTITCLYILNSNKLVINKKGYYYLIPIILIISGTIIFKTNISNMLINIIIIPVLLSFLFFTLTNQFYHVSGLFLKWFFKLFPDKLFTNLSYLKENLKIKSTKKNQIANILQGLLISIPFVAVILFLLTSADAYFKSFISKLSTWFSYLARFDTLKNNILIFIIFFLIAFSLIVNIINNQKTKMTDASKKNITPSIINTVLIMINFVFMLFIISEISKITGNFLKLPVAYTYAKYAREGFFQLLAVTVINFSLILFLLYKTNAIKENKLLKKLLIALIIFTIILIFNSYYRMFLYIKAYGFTVLRMQVVLFLLMELIISFTMIKKIIAKLKHQDAYIFLYVITTTYIINIFICNINVITLINKLLNK